jgi:hypothetical protein
MCNSSDGVAATDPASASPGRMIASFALSCAWRYANSVPTKPRGTLAERGREGRRPSCHCPTEFPNKRFGASTHLAHETQPKCESAQRSGRIAVDKRKSMTAAEHYWNSSAPTKRLAVYSPE